MSAHNENSSLVALRELREMERRRLHDEQQVAARVEKERLEQERAQSRAREERLAREHAEHEAAQARESAESTRLRRELDVARSEMAQLRGQLLSSSMALARAASLAPSAPVAVANRSRPWGWMAASIGATLLAGGLAISTIVQSNGDSAPFVHQPSKAAPACPKSPSLAPSASGPAATRPPEPAASASAKLGPKPRPTASARPKVDTKPAAKPVAKPTSGNACDGTDPLCGIDSNVMDDMAKARRRGGKTGPR